MNRTKRRTREKKAKKEGEERKNAGERNCSSFASPPKKKGRAAEGEMKKGGASRSANWRGRGTGKKKAGRTGKKKREARRGRRKRGPIKEGDGEARLQF